MEIRRRFFQTGAVGVCAVRLYVFVGIEIAFKLQDANLQVFIQQHLDGSLGRICAGGIGIEIHNDSFGVALQRADLGVGERRAAARDDVAHARRKDADDIHVAFHEH